MHQRENRSEPESGGGIGRRLFLKSATGVAAGAAGAALLPGTPALAAASGSRRAPARLPGAAPVPKVLRSSRALDGSAAATVPATLPITMGGTTYEMAQEARWLDGQHFAVGRWDGSMSIFHFETAQYVGPLISEAVNDPAFQGVQMLTALPGPAIATSNDATSIALWHAAGGDWTRLRLVTTCSYDPSLGSATAGAALSVGTSAFLVVGHANGYLSTWSYHPATRALTFLRSVNVQNPSPTNPFGDHTIEDVVVADAASGVVAAGSEDGYVTMMNAGTGAILSQTVFNPAAQRGINAIAIEGNKLLVANCSVGPSDYNLWYYLIDKSSWAITLLDKANLIIDSSRPQVFNFDVVWGRHAGAPCWFASTEEGALWMGTPSSHALDPIGYQQLTSPLGSALAYRNGELVMVAYDLYQFTTAP